MIEGIGVHSGRGCRVRLERTDGPVRFRRGRALIPARVEAVVGTEGCTVLGAGAARVAMVEHLLAALRVRGFWSGVLIEASSDELPILDGSAAPWLALLDELGPPPPPPEPLVPAGVVRVARGAATATVEPGPPHLEAVIEFDHPAVGRQRWAGPPERWAELLDARTFGFLSDYEALAERGLARGASTENAIVFDGAGPLSPLRHPDEPARHKALDAIGDLFLLGRPLAGRLRVVRGSHGLHLDLMHQLLASHHPVAEPRP